MAEIPEGLRILIQDPFAGDDVVEAVNSPTALESLHMVLDPVAVPGFITEMVADSSFRQERTGVEGFYDAWRDWAAPFERLRLENVESRRVGDSVLSVVDQTGVPKGTDTEINQPAAAVWFLEDERLARVEFHLDVDVARRAAGLG
jgi:hypothetical protein